MTSTDTKITRYTDGDYLIDIVEKDTEFEAWLQHKDFGVSMLMFGVRKGCLQGVHLTPDIVAAMVECNLPEQKEIYANTYQD